MIKPDFEGRWPKIALNGIYELNLGNGTQFSVFLMWPGVFYCLGIEGVGAFHFSTSVHWEYAAEKLNLGEADARNIADFINAQLEAQDFGTQGFYDQRYL